MVNPNAGILEEIEDQKLNDINIGADEGPHTITVVSITGGCPTLATWCFMTTETFCPTDPTG